MMLFRLAALLAISGWPLSAFAWNNLGHKVVAEIAWRQLDPSTRQEVVETLRRHPRFDIDFAAKVEDEAAKGDKATQDRWIFQHAATWPDIARGLKGQERQTYNRPEWHYIDLPLYLNPSDRKAFGNNLPVNISLKYPSPIEREHYNVVQAIAYARQTLAGRAGPDVKAVAYCWLFHLVGDLHQPLHSTALFSMEHFPKGDKGGNEIPLTRGRNLHSLWDGLLGSQYYTRNVDKAVTELSDRERYGDVWNFARRETDPRKWAAESHKLATSFVYDDLILKAVRGTPPEQKIEPIMLSDAYLKEAGDRARRRVIAAGLRLGVLLGEPVNSE
jgi:hypothetical protein